MFITETHLHTSDISPCGKIRAEEMVELYKKEGYSTVCVSDHFMSYVFDVLGDISWEDKVTVFMSSYYRAKTVGDKLGVNVILAPEFHFQKSVNDYIALGVTKEFLVAHPELPNMTIEEFYPVAKENGLFVIQAHPYRDGMCYATPDFADALEAYNSSPRHENYTEKTLKLATEHGLFVTAGSDAHRHEDVALTGLISDSEIRTADELIELIRSGNARIYRKGEEE